MVSKGCISSDGNGGGVCLPRDTLQEVLIAVIDIDEIRSYRNAIRSRSEQVSFMISMSSIGPLHID